MINDLKYLVKHWMGSFLSFLLLFYFIFHIAYGDRGYFALKRLNLELSNLEASHQKLTTDRKALEHRVKLLRPTSIGLDILDERSREVLGLIGDGEYIILSE